MFILTCASQLENNKNSTYQTKDAVLEATYLNERYHQHERSYTIKEQHKEYTVICPEFRKSAKGNSPIVILPDFLISGRHYPVYIYLYAINLYSADPEKGQRWAAAETRKKFGLATFAHTTLGRALKAFVRNIGVEAADAPAYADAMGDASNETEPSRFPAVHDTAVPRIIAAQFLREKLPEAAGQDQEAVASYCTLASEFFKEHGHFLL